MLARRRVRWRMLGAILLALAVLGGVIVGAHEYQSPRTAKLLERNVTLAEKEGKLGDAIATLRLYAAMNPNDSDVQERLAVMLTKLGDYRADLEANNRLRQLLRRDPDRPTAKAALLELAIRLDDLPEAKKQADDLEQLAPPTAPWMAMAQLFQSQKENRKAAAAFKRALEVDPKNLSAYQRYADLLVLSMNDRDAATRLLEAMLAKNPANPLADLVAYVVRRDHKLNDADAALDAALIHGPANIEVLLMAAGRDMERNPEKAKKLLERARQVAPQDVRIPMVLGKLLVASKDYTGALRQFEDGFERSNRTDPELAWRAAEILVELKKTESLAKYLGVLVRHPRFRPVHAFLRARSDALAGKSTEALNGFESAKTALEAPIMQGAPPEYRREIAFKIELGLAGSYVQDNRPIEAMEAAVRARDLAPADPLPWLTIAGVQQWTRRFDVAAVSYRTALDKTGCPRLAAFNLAQVLLFDQSSRPIDSRDFREFQAAFDAVERTMPNLPELAQLKAQHLLATGKIAEAAIALKAGLQSHPGNVGIWLSLIRTLGAAGAYDEAMQHATRLEARFGRSVASATTIAKLHLDRSNPKAAVALLEATRQSSTDRFKGELSLPLAQAFWLAGDVERAATEFAAAAANDDADHFALSSHFDFLLVENGPAAAAAMVEKLNADDETFSLWAKVWLASTNPTMKFAEVVVLGRTNLDRLKKIRPFWWGTQELEGFVEEVDGDPIRAIRAYRRALTGGPAFAFVADRMMQLQFANRRVADAADFLDQLKMQRLPRPSDNCLAIDLLAAQGKSAEAQTLAEQLVAKRGRGTPWVRWLERLRQNSR